jgi:Glyoxalase/Bleomycin resistance protein/Dioxygenase superfamily
MPEFPIDQRTDAVIQIAYAVPDLKAAISWWIEELGVGPWFVLDRIGREGTTYRGRPADAEFTIGMAYSGKMMFELIQALDDKPSIYKEERERKGYGFHHLAKIRPNVRQLAEAYQAKGRQILFHSPTPGGGEVFFVEGGKHAPGLLELVEDKESTRGIFENVWRASVDWKGERPIRSFSELLIATQPISR